MHAMTSFRPHIARAVVASALLTLLLALPAAHAATVSSDGTTATYTSDPGKRDYAYVKTIDAGKVEFEVQSPETIAEGANCTEVSAQRTTCLATKEVVADLRDNDDTFHGYGLKTHALTGIGDAGHDTIHGGGLGDDLRGGEGNDTLGAIMEGPAGADRVDGGPGDDAFIVGAESDEAIGGTGVDRASVVLFDTGATGFPAVDLNFSLDDRANDGRATDGGNVHADVENVGSYLTDQKENGMSSTWSDEEFLTEGRLTARATDGPNSVWGGAANDDLDPLAGNDIVSAGFGDDTIRTVDGFADRVACGPGNDTLAADTLDGVSDSCENVERVDAGNANDAPGAPEDAPPTVAFTGTSPIAVTATDDRGVGSVMVLDDDRLVCTDDTAPYTCDHVPGAEDVGRNTLTAIAVDTAQQTASDRRVVTVPKFTPDAVTLRVAKGRASGRVLLPPQVSETLGCAGDVAVAVKRGKRTTAKRSARVKRDCTYSVRVSARGAKRRVQARFAGNAVLRAKASPLRKAPRV